MGTTTAVVFVGNVNCIACFRINSNSRFLSPGTRRAVREVTRGRGRSSTAPAKVERYFFLPDLLNFTIRFPALPKYNVHIVL